MKGEVSRPLSASPGRVAAFGMTGRRQYSFFFSLMKRSKNHPTAQDLAKIVREC